MKKIAGIRTTENEVLCAYCAQNNNLSGEPIFRSHVFDETVMCCACGLLVPCKLSALGRKLLLREKYSVQFFGPDRVSEPGWYYVFGTFLNYEDPREFHGGPYRSARSAWKRAEKDMRNFDLNYTC